MTLFRQLVVTIVLLFVALFGVTLVVNLANTRTFLADQLSSHAQDTATSLGLSLSHAMSGNDLPTMESMVNAIFDRGYYSEIRVDGIDSTVLIRRESDVRIEGIPSWFIGWLPMTVPEASAIVMSGWQQAGNVVVRSHPGYAYRDLWEIALQLLVLYSVLALAAMLIGWGVMRVLLRPLRAIEAQARAIRERNFDVTVAEPRTREMRSVVAAMNQMTRHVKQTFAEQAASAERWRDQAFSDGVTGLGNRRYFRAQARGILTSEEEAPAGALLLVQLEGLDELNAREGFAAGDALLRDTAKVLGDSPRHHTDALVARLEGAGFGVLIPGLSVDGSERLAERLCDRITRLRDGERSPGTNVVHIGVAAYRRGDRLEELLSAADTALNMARAQAPNSWFRLQRATLPRDVVPGKQEWKALIESALDKGEVILHGQPVLDLHRQGEFAHVEIFARIPTGTGELWNAGMFIPMAERVGLAAAVDQLVVTKVTETVGARGGGRTWAVNLTPSSLEDPGFVGWLMERLEKVDPEQARIIVEISESRSRLAQDDLQAFVDVLRGTGHGFALDHFGRGFYALGSLRSLRPEYIKIDGAYTRSIAADQDDRFLVGAICNVAHSIQVQAIAESVESEAQREALLELNLDGLQGYLIGRPAALESML